MDFSLDDIREELGVTSNSPLTTHRSDLNAPLVSLD